MMGDIEELSKVLGNTTAVIGGIAVNAWGFSRNTGDVDFASALSPQILLERLLSLGIAARLRTGDPDDPLPWVVAGHYRQTGFQIIPNMSGIDFGASIVLPGTEVRIVDLEGLIRTKIYAGGPKDLWDVANLVLMYPDALNMALEEAKKHQLENRLREWISDTKNRVKESHEDDSLGKGVPEF